MTYNFDPDQWYENELFVILAKVKAGRMTQQEQDEAIEELDRNLKTMWDRLDNSYQVPK